MQDEKFRLVNVIFTHVIFVLCLVSTFKQTQNNTADN